MTTPTLNYVTRITDDRGMPSIELLKLFAELAAIIDGQATTIAAQAATIADHEARITALEP